MCINVISNGKMVHFLVVMVDKSTLRINCMKLKCVVVKSVEDKCGCGKRTRGKKKLVTKTKGFFDCRVACEVTLAKVTHETTALANEFEKTET